MARLLATDHQLLDILHHLVRLQGAFRQGGIKVVKAVMAKVRTREARTKVLIRRSA
jgi:hypothetical protein